MIFTYNTAAENGGTAVKYKLSYCMYSMYACMYVCMYVFIKLHITTQSGPVILVILCHSH